MPRFMTGRWLCVLAVVGVGGFLVHTLLRPTTSHWRTVTVQRADIEQVVLASGTLMPVRQVSVGAQVNGQLKSLKVKDGDRVRKGELLAEIDPVLQKIQVREAQAGLENIEAQRDGQVAQLRQYEKDLAREQVMRRDDASTPADLDAAQSRVDVTRASIRALEAQRLQAQIQMETANANLEYTRITAPIDGQVIAVATQEGQTVVSAQVAPTILVLADLRQMLVKVRISEADVNRVHPGQEVWFSVLGDPQHRYRSRLQSIDLAPPLSLISQDSAQGPADASASSTVYYNGMLQVDNADGRLRPWQTAQVSIVLGRQQNVLSVPAGVIHGPDRDGRSRVDVLPRGQNSSPESRQVTTGISDGISVQILSGLREGERVIAGQDDTADSGKDHDNTDPS